jgi:hypothetical protein
MRHTVPKTALGDETMIVAVPVFLGAASALVDR